MLAAGVTLSVSGALLGFGDLVRIGILTLLLPVVSLLLARRNRIDVEVTRHVEPALVTATEPVTVRVSLRPIGARATPGQFATEHFRCGRRGTVRTVVPVLRPGRPWEFHYQVTPARRGRHQFGPLELHRYDAFGLIRSTVLLRRVTQIIALPVVHPLTGGVLSGTSTGGDVGALAGVDAEGDAEGHHLSLAARHTPYDMSLRAYQEGDDLRRVHWPVTAHRGELMVRYEGRPPTRRALIVLGGYAVAPGSPPLALDWMVEALASVAVQLAAVGYELHVVTAETLHEGTGGLRLTTVEALQALAVIEPEDAAQSDGPDLEALAAARDLARGGDGGGVVITAVGDHDATTAREVLSVAGHGSQGLLFVVDEASFRGSSKGTGTTTGPPVAADAMRIAGLAGDRGWRSVLVRRGDTVSDRWAALTYSPEIGADR